MTSKAKATAAKPQWAFRSRFRRSAFGWRGSRLAMDRIDQALSEIRAVARHDPTAAAEGAVLFLEKISPALCEVDSSSGALGNAVHAAVETLVPIIAAPTVSAAVRGKWLERLFMALQDDDPPYIESLSDHWGELCASAELASRWADDLISLVRRVAEDRRRGVYAYSKATTVCYSALLAAGRHDELLELLAIDPKLFWHDALWGGRVLAAQGRIDDAIAYVLDRSGGKVPRTVLATFAEGLLLTAGRSAEAYARFAVDANRANSNLATFRAIARKYPDVDPDRLLLDLIASTPGEDGKWFATAKSLKRLELAMELAERSPCDPKTLIRAARDHLVTNPVFAAGTALAALRWISEGYGYDLTVLDARDAYAHMMDAANRAGSTTAMSARLEQLLSVQTATTKWLRQAIGLPM